MPPVTQDIHRIEVATPFRIGAVNAYLLDGDPLTLIDTGPRWPPALEALEAGLAALGRRLEDIELVLLTHQHVDHLGLAREIRRRGGARIGALDELAVFAADFPAMWEAEDDFAESVMRGYGTPPERIRAIRDLSRSFAAYGEAVPVDLTFGNNDVIEAGGRSLRVLVRPGHSPTDTLFVDEGAGLAFGGDHLLGRVSSNPVIHRPLNPRGPGREPTLARYLESLERTAALELALVLPGHGDAVTDAGALVESRIRHHMERKEVIADLIGRGSRTVTDLSRDLWGDVETSQVYLAVSEVVGHTDLLRAEGRLEERDVDGIVEFAPNA
jgi:glyoxylase-like metal-dependent hydrolase (beta-lactamase superfamily II)